MLKWRKLIGLIGVLTKELEGTIVSQKWNSERYIVFQMVVLQTARDVKTSSAI
jgi:hypothetical protein